MFSFLLILAAEMRTYYSISIRHNTFMIQAAKNTPENMDIPRCRIEMSGFYYISQQNLTPQLLDKLICVLLNYFIFVKQVLYVLLSKLQNV